MEKKESVYLYKQFKIEGKRPMICSNKNKVEFQIKSTKGINFIESILEIIKIFEPILSITQF